MRTLLTRLLQVRHPNAEVQLRGRLIIMIALTLAGLTLPSLVLLFVFPATIRLVMLAVFVAALALHSTVVILAHSGRVAVAGLLLMTQLIGMSLMQIAVFQNAPMLSFFLVLTLIIASLIFPPRLIWLILGLDLAGVALGIALVPGSFDPERDQLSITLLFTVLLMTAIFSFIGARVLQTALREGGQARKLAETSRDALQAINESLESQVQKRTAELNMTLLDAEERMADQSAILAQLDHQQDMINRLSMPVLPISARVLVMPLVGVLDEERIGQLRRGLNAVEETRARWLLLDVTGLSLIDEKVAAALMELVRAVRMLGADVLLVGVRPEVAQTLVSMGVSINDLRTQSTLQDGIAFVQRQEAA